MVSRVKIHQPPACADRDRFETLWLGGHNRASGRPAGKDRTAYPGASIKCPGLRPLQSADTAHVAPSSPSANMAGTGPAPASPSGSEATARAIWLVAATTLRVESNM